MAEGALPKGFEKPSGSSSQSSASPKKRGVNKIGMAIAIGITVFAVIVGIGFTGVIPMDVGLSSLMPTAPIAPVPQEPYWNFFVPTQSSGSYAPSDGNLIDQLDWSISTGDVVAMYLDKGSSSLIIHTDTVYDGELFVGLNADYIGSDDGTFFILVDNQEHEDYEQAGMDLYINLPAGAEKVEIIGSYVIL